jgi:hypothetical protein
MDFTGLENQIDGLQRMGGAESFVAPLVTVPVLGSLSVRHSHRGGWLGRQSRGRSAFRRHPMAMLPSCGRLRRNTRVLKWIVECARGRALGKEAAVGWQPRCEDSLIKSAGITGIFSSVKTKLDLFTSVPGQRKRRDLGLAHEFDSSCFH